MSIKYKPLGKQGVQVSNICLGTMNFGWHTSEQDSFRIMDRALELGINFFDTADMYGWSVENGHTEEIIGRWLAQGGGRRDAIVLATKLYQPMKRKEKLHEVNSASHNLSAYKIRKHCEGSLQRMQTEHIDLLQMHHIDRACPWDEIWQSFEILAAQGKITYTGSSNFAGWDIATACQEAAKRRTLGLVSEQSIYHLDNRMIELEVIPACRYYGVGLLPWSPLGGGLLGGVIEKQAAGRRTQEHTAKRIESKRPQLERYEEFCRHLGHPPGEVAIAWLLHNPCVTAPVVGPRTLEQLESAVRAAAITLDIEALKTLDTIFPGPGGEAPKAYAW